MTFQGTRNVYLEPQEKAFEKIGHLIKFACGVLFGSLKAEKIDKPSLQLNGGSAD